MRNAVNPPHGAGRLIEHPGRNLQPSVRCRARDAAAKYRSVSLLDHLMDVDVVPRPWVPGIENFTHLGPVGVLASCSTTADVLIHRLTGKRPIRPTSTRRSQSRSRHDRGGNPLNKPRQTVQTNRATSQEPSVPSGGEAQEPSEGLAQTRAELGPAGMMAKPLGQPVAGHCADMVAIAKQPVGIAVGQFEEIHHVAQTVARQARRAQGRVIERDRQGRIVATIGPQLVGGQVLKPSQRT